MIDVGVVLPTRLRPNPLGPGPVLRIAETADQEAGWSQVWVTDSVVSLPFYDSVVVLAACAARTTRVRLGVACQASLGCATRSSSPNSGQILTCCQAAA
jgi:hypothetical protein